MPRSQTCSHVPREETSFHVAAQPVTLHGPVPAAAFPQSESVTPTETTGPAAFGTCGVGGQESPGHTRAAGSGGHTGRISVAGFPWRSGVDGEAEMAACSAHRLRADNGRAPGDGGSLVRPRPGEGSGRAGWLCRPWSGRACTAVKRCPSPSLRPSLQKRREGRFRGHSLDSFGRTFSSDTGWRTRKGVNILHTWKCIKSGVQNPSQHGAHCTRDVLPRLTDAGQQDGT